ncbi:MAG: hypothetical protein R2825_28550 [Saprospiraceae bacterium]
MFRLSSLVLIISTLLFLGCREKEIIIELINDSDFILENISVEIMDKTKRTNPINLSPKETKIITLDFSNVPQMDGHYMINFKQNGKVVSDEFGYFTNGQPMEDKWQLTIGEDTIVFSSTMDNSH